jgi:hypothetical protein
MNKRKFITALALFNTAVFILATLFLPSAGTYRFSGPISKFINSRTDWHVAFLVTVASILISWGIYLVLLSFRETEKSDK